MRRTVILVVCLAVLIPVCDVAAQVDPEERAALIALYNATNGPGWLQNSGWDTAILDSECTWVGVTCSGGHVTELFLRENQLSGTIPADVGDLVYLSVLNLTDNDLSGGIPSELAGISGLSELRLSFNQLSGAIPPELGTLSGLTVFLASFNQLDGGIPPELGDLSNLTLLFLSSNELTGGIPPELGDLGSLTRLYLYSNHLSGAIPPELGNLSNLDRLQLHNNQLSGRIPSQLGNLVNLDPDPSRTDIGYNALWTDDPALQAFLGTKDPDWDQTQTIAPADISVGSETSWSLVVSWTPIPYTADTGWYSVIAPSGWIFSDGFETGDTTVWEGGENVPTPLPLEHTTMDKTDSWMFIDALDPGTTYIFVVRTITEPHTNPNQVVSEDSRLVLGTTTP